MTLIALACTKGPAGGDAPRSEPDPGSGAAAKDSTGRAAVTGAVPGASSNATVPSAAEPARRLNPRGERVTHGRHGMVSSVEAHATRAGVEMLELGGNAIDAAVAVGYALAVTHPSAGNLGGGGFMLLKMAKQQSVAVDFRERAPGALTQSGFDVMIAERAEGPRASGVPGTVAGLNLAHSKYGKLTLSQVLAPAIKLASAGHTLGKRQALVLGWAWPRLHRDKAARQTFGQRGQPLQAGGHLTQARLAQTLERIAKNGNDGFYAGETAKQIVAAMKRDGGWITLGDLKDYRAVERIPLRIDYRGFDVEVMPPPSAGGVAIVQMLAMLQAEHAERFAPGSVDGLHLFAEVAKRAHAERRFGVVDPDSVEAYDAEAHRRRWADASVWLKPFPISMSQATPASKLHRHYEAARKELDNTTHFSVVDRDGNAVSCTTTLSAGFGAKYMVEAIGVVMNNSVAAFGTVGEDVPKPGRRMTSSMSPTLLLQGDDVVAVLGSPGGDTIPNTVVQVLRNLIDAGMTLDDAVDAPRIHHGFVPDAIRHETQRAPRVEVVAALKQRGHQFTRSRLTIGDANNILIDGPDGYGYADPREGGLAAGPKRAPPVAPTTSAATQPNVRR
jgi:gamma-glutamyltranspeptidase/glutathione hydrolase